MAYKVALLSMEAFPFNADEAIVGLMARHTLQGSWPAFFYGQAYMGSLDASLVALAFAAWGEQVNVIRAVQIVLYAGTVLSTMFLARQIYRSNEIAIFSGLLMAIPTVNTTLYTTVSLGGYGEAVLIGNLLMILALKAGEAPHRPWIPLLWGGLAGIGFWGFGLTLVYALPAAALLLATLWRELPPQMAFRQVAGTAAAWILGALPWVLAVVQGHLEPFLHELLGSAIAGASPSNLPQAVGSHFLNLVLFGSTVILGMRPPWEVRWLAWPLLPLATLFGILLVIHACSALKLPDGSRTGRRLLWGVSIALIAGFLLTPFGADPSGRYFLPLAVPMAIFGGELLASLKRRVNPLLSYAWLVTVLGFNLWGTLEAALRNPPGITTQFDPVTQVDQSEIDSLIEFLEAEQETRGYTNYWVAYPLAFRSEERLIYIPRLPYHTDFRYTERDDRYAPYRAQVEASERVAYITTHHEALNERIRDTLLGNGIAWKEAEVGDFQVFYALSWPIDPASILALPEEG